MGNFEDFKQVYEPLRLPINGKTYTLPAVTIADGARFKLVLAGDTSVGTFTDDEFETMLLGPDLKAEMIADGVSDAALQRVMLTALCDHQQGREAAEIMWATGADPKALTQYVKSHGNRAQRRSKTTAAGTKTRSRASTSGTKPRPAPSPKQESPSTGS